MPKHHLSGQVHPTSLCVLGKWQRMPCLFWKIRDLGLLLPSWSSLCFWLSDLYLQPAIAVCMACVYIKLYTDGKHWTVSVLLCARGTSGLSHESWDLLLLTVPLVPTIFLIIRVLPSILLPITPCLLFLYVQIRISRICCSWDSISHR